MFTVGIIPAAGNGTRWGGYVKEMLPVADDVCLIDHVAAAMSEANAVIVITNDHKLPILARRMVYDDLPVFFAIQQGDRDMWSAIIEACQFPADRYLFAMPDTLYPIDTFDDAPLADFALGIFETDKPERFGVLHGDGVVNKANYLAPNQSYQAWGNLVWSRACVELWQEARPKDYTEAINIAIETYGLHTWHLDYYHDMATFEDYREWLINQ